jgi:hypothetical protein
MATPEFLRFLVSNEQDRAACEQWWREASREDKLAVWGVITRRYKDPRMKVMARFAQLTFCEMAEKGMRKLEEQE